MDEINRQTLSAFNNLDYTSLPLGANPARDIPFGKDELGRQQYRTAGGKVYVINQVTPERKFESEPGTLERVGEVGKSYLQGAVEGIKSAISPKTYGDVFTAAELATPGQIGGKLKTKTKPNQKGDETFVDDLADESFSFVPQNIDEALITIDEDILYGLSQPENSVFYSKAIDKQKFLDTFGKDWVVAVAEFKPHYNDVMLEDYYNRIIRPAAEETGVSVSNVMEMVHDLENFFPKKDPAVGQVATRILPDKQPIGQRASDDWYLEGSPRRPSDPKAEALGFKDTVYHSTISPEEFTEFDINRNLIGDTRSAQDLLGVHVGTARAAAERNLSLFKYNLPDDVENYGHTLELRARANKPVTKKDIVEITGVNPDTLDGPDPAILNELELNEAISAYADKHKIDLNEAAVKLRKELAEKEYTHIPYVNAVEDPDSTSFIMLVDRPKNSPAVLRDVRAEFDPEKVTNPDLRFNKGGLATKGVDDQMKQIFAEGGITDDGMKRDPVSGNEVPPGSLAEEVRDDIDAKLSTGEYVVPADVVRYFGVAYFEKLRKKAKEGLGEMEADGRIGGEPEDDDFPFSEDELEFEDDLEMAEGGVVMGQPNPQAFSAPSNPMFDRGQFSMGTVQQGIESRRYINPQTGEQRSFTFINGQPVGAIPQGFVPYTEELAAQTTKAPVASPTEGLRPTLQDGTERGPGRTQEERDQRAGTSEDRVGGGFGASNYDELTQDPLGFAKKALDPTFIDRGIVGGAALFAGPIAGLGVKEGIKLENIAQANAAKQIAESQGLDTTEIDRLIEGAVKGLSGVAKRLYEADRVATGQNYAQSYFEESAKRTPATLQTPSVPTAAGITTSRLAPSTPSTPTSGYTLTGSDIDYLRTQGVSSANTALPGDKATPQETTALAMSYGPQRPVTPAPSPAPVTGGQKTQEERNAGQTSRPSTGEAQTLRFGDTRSEGFGDWALSGISSGPGRTQEERDARGGDSVGGGRTGSPRGGRATGGLVDKPQKHKTKSRRKIKTVEK